MISKTDNCPTLQTELDIAHKLRKEFYFGAAKFANNPLHQKLRSDLPIKSKLSFLPKMVFFVMGFKDLMQIVRYPNPVNQEQENVNIHSDEDSNHWVWFLKDLKLVSGKFSNTQPDELIASVWSDDTLAVRNTIYTFSRYIRNIEEPVARMLMVEVLEITFNKFKEAIHPVLKNAGLYDQLAYFGKVHQETEENHTTGTSDDEIGHLIDLLPDHLREEMLLVVNELFDHMYQMAASWSSEV